MGGGSSGYDLDYLSEQAKNLSDAFKSDYGLSSETKAKPAQPKKSIFADRQDKQDKQNKEESSTVKTKFFSLSPAYKKALSSVSNIPRQTASVFSSILSPVGDFVSSLFINENVSEVATGSYKVESSSSYKVGSSSSSPSVISAPRPSEVSSEGGKAGTQAVSNSSPSDPASSAGRLQPVVKTDITRKEVENLIKQSDNRNIALIRSVLTAPNPLSNSDSLFVQQSLANLSRRISVIQENNVRQLDHTYNSISRSFDDITSLDGVTMTGSSFSGTTGTFTGVFSGASGTFSSNLTVGSQLIVSGAGTSTLSGDTNFDSGTLYIDSVNNRVGIASSSPSETLSINGATYLSQISAPSNTTDRLYNASGDLYWAGNLIGSASVGNWTSSGGNVYRSSGNVGIGTTSPYAKLSVVGEIVAEKFTATSTTATSTFNGGLSITGTGTGLNFGSDTLFYQNNQRFLTSSTTAAGNLTIGYQSATRLDANGGLYNTGVGYQVLENATSTGYNTALGYQALKGSATISNLGYNTAVGYQALYANSSGSYNVAVGQSALDANTTGNANVAVGWRSLNANTTGNFNVAVGRQSMASNNTGGQNTGLGLSALYSNTTGTGNVGLGYYSGYGDGTTVDQRSVIDNYATFIGLQASRSESVASTSALTNITAIGKNARVGRSNSIVLGGTGADAVNVGIGTTSPYARLSVVGETVSSYFTATSTTATSTFAGGMNVAGTAGLTVLQNGKVGVGTTSPYARLSVVGETVAEKFTATSTTATSTFAGGGAICDRWRKCRNRMFQPRPHL